MSTMVADRTYSTQEVSEATGASYRQLDYWDRKGLVGPGSPGSGNQRRWSEDDLALCRVLAALTRLGCSGHCLATLAGAFRGRLGGLPPNSVLIATPEGEYRGVPGGIGLEYYLSRFSAAWVVRLD